MPLSEPRGGFSAGSGAVMGVLPIRNTGADLGINLQAASWDSVNNRILIGGDNDFVGTKTDVFAKMQQVANLPPSNNTCTGIGLKFDDSGVFFLDGANAVFRTDSAFGAWVTITPPAASTRRGFFTQRGNDRIYTVTINLAAPARNIEFSDDDGVTWDSNPGLNSGISASATWVRNNRIGTLVAMGGVGDYAVTETPNDNASWEIFAMATAGINQNVAAFSDDNTQMVVGANNGQISTVTGGLTAGNEFDILPANNPFAQAVNNGLAINFCEYLPRLGGFLLASIASELVGFISSNDMTTVQQGMFLGTGPTVSTARSGSSAVDDNSDAIAVGNSNLGAAFVRFT